MNLRRPVLAGACLATGDIDTVAAMLGSTPEAIAEKLGVSVADLRAALPTTTTR